MTRNVILYKVIALEKETCGLPDGVLEKLFNNKETISVLKSALDRLSPDLWGTLINKLKVPDNLEEISDGLYQLTINDDSYQLGVKNPGEEQAIGIFKFKDKVYWLLSGKQQFTPNKLNHFKKAEEGEWNENEML